MQVLTFRSVEMSMATACNIHIELPTSDDFDNAKLMVDDKGIKEVEG
jgi:alpha-acetolactate decarboxylase